jgi:hypothetical protein
MTPDFLSSAESDPRTMHRPTAALHRRTFPFPTLRGATADDDADTLEARQHLTIL